METLYCVLALILGILAGVAWNRPKKVAGAFVSRFGGEELKMQFIVPKTSVPLSVISAECCKVCISLYQSVHATPSCQRWESTGWRKIVLKCDSEEELSTLQREAQDLAIPNLMRASKVGVKVLCLGPAEDSMLSKVTGALKLL